MARKSSAYTAAELKLLRETYGHIAYTVKPVEGGPEAESAAGPVIEKLQGLGLLTEGREPQLTAEGREVCRRLAEQGWKA